MQQPMGRPRPRAEPAFRYLEEVELVPCCLQKASMYRESLDHMPQAVRDALLACELPAEVEALVDMPALHATWIPEAHVHAYFLAVAELCQPTEVRFLKAAYRVSTKLFTSNAYRLLMTAVTPGTVMRSAPRVWQLLHRGTEMVIEPQTSGVVVRLHHPRNHLTPTLARMYGVAFAGTIESAGAMNVRVDLEAVTPNQTVWRTAWG